MYRDVFECQNGYSGRKAVKYKINTEDAKHIRQVARRLPQVKREKAEKIIQLMQQE